jgi:pyruvate/2-oxoglutarate dehydrogenase complex dihydrolipoamide acyltransferase (E2) component
MTTEQILIPDIGNFESVDVIDVLVNVGDSISTDDSLITVESDKASMDIPAPKSGVIREIKLKVGDKVKEGSLVAVIETEAEASPLSVNLKKKFRLKRSLRKLFLNRRALLLNRQPPFNRLKIHCRLVKVSWSVKVNIVTPPLQ